MCDLPELPRRKSRGKGSDQSRGKKENGLSKIFRISRSERYLQRLIECLENEASQEATQAETKKSLPFVVKSHA